MLAGWFVLDIYLLWRSLRDALQPRYRAEEATAVARLLVEDVYGRVPLYEGQYSSESRAAQRRLARRLVRVEAGEAYTICLRVCVFFR